MGRAVKKLLVLKRKKGKPRCNRTKSRIEIVPALLFSTRLLDIIRDGVFTRTGKRMAIYNYGNVLLFLSKRIVRDNRVRQLPVEKTF